MKNLNWLKKEIEKDKKEIFFHKKKIIQEIINTPKTQITTGPKIIRKTTAWNKIIKKLQHLFRV